VIRALLSALLFGASAPLAKILLRDVDPLVLAGLLYLGSGLGLALARMIVPPAGESPLERRDVPWLGAAILCGGVAAPVLLLLGLQSAPAGVAALFLNLETVFTLVIAALFFREHVGARIVAGMACIFAGGALLSFSPGTSAAAPLGMIAAACLLWAADNNFTRVISGSDATAIAMWKGLFAGGVNIAAGLFLGRSLPSTGLMLATLVVGFACYGASLVLFVQALREVGAARTSACFSTAPFVGMALSVVSLRESTDARFWMAGALMALGVWLHLTERHGHAHHHHAHEHSHPHRHDDMHHDHHHEGLPPGTVHAHHHQHGEMAHEHVHFPDLHHGHDH